MQLPNDEIIYDVHLQPGEPLSLPPQAKEILGPGNYRILIVPVSPLADQALVRDHSAFLNSYAAEDEGLYDDYSSR